MKHIFEFNGQAPQTGGTGSRYVGKVPTEWLGFRAELIACDTDGNGIGGDTLYLEGDGKALRLMLKGLLACLDSVERIAREEKA